MAESGTAQPLDVERGSDVYRLLTLTFREADAAFEAAGDAGTRTFLDDYFLPALKEHGLTVARLGTASEHPEAHGIPPAGMTMDDPEMLGLERPEAPDDPWSDDAILDRALGPADDSHE